MFFSWLKSQRRNALMAERFPRPWEDWLRRNVRHYSYLTRRQQARVRQTVQVVVAEKTWVGGSGFAVSDEMKVTVAGQAALLALGMEKPYFFDGVRSIILYEGPYEHPARFREHYGILGGPVAVAGEAWHRGPIILAWREVLADGRDARGGKNLVLHEFAHYIDGLDGDIDGSPPLAGREQSRTWYRVTEAEYLRLVGRARRDEVSLLDHYGASNRAEFFAVATECFFEQPRAMQRQHEELYGVLRDFYRQDPARWLPDAAVSPAPPVSGNAPTGKGRAGDAARRARDSRLAKLRSSDPDTWFMMAVTYMDERRYALAARAATRAIELAPDDAEAYCQRAMARVKQGRYAEALADCNEALRLEPKDLVAYRTRGAAWVGLEQYDRAAEDLDHVLAEDKEDAEARYYRGRAWAGQGDLRRAVRDLSRSAAVWPLAPEVHYHLGLAYRASGNPEAAETELAKARQLDPEIERKNVWESDSL
jgi:MtfA peptidase